MYRRYLFLFFFFDNFFEWIFYAIIPESGSIARLLKASRTKSISQSNTRGTRSLTQIILHSSVFYFFFSHTEICIATKARSIEFSKLETFSAFEEFRPTSLFSKYNSTITFISFFLFSRTARGQQTRKSGLSLLSIDDACTIVKKHHTSFGIRVFRKVHVYETLNAKSNGTFPPTFYETRWES